MNKFLASMTGLLSDNGAITINAASVVTLAGIYFGLNLTPEQVKTLLQAYAIIAPVGNVILHHLSKPKALAVPAAAPAQPQ